MAGLEDAMSLQAEDFDFGNDPGMLGSQFPGYSRLPSPPNFENVSNEFQYHEFDELPTHSAAINHTEASPQWHLYWNETPDDAFPDPLYPADTLIALGDEAIGAQNYLIPGPGPGESNDNTQLQTHQDDIACLEGKLFQRCQKQRHFHHQQILVLRKWLRSNLCHPFPSSDDKEQLSSVSGLSVRQVERWFARTRARHLAENRGLTAADLADKVSAQIRSRRGRPSDLDNIVASRPCSANESSLMVAVASPPEGPTSLTSSLSFELVSPMAENDLTHGFNDFHEEPDGDIEGSLVAGWLTLLPDEFETVPESCTDLSDGDEGARAACEHLTKCKLVLDFEGHSKRPSGHYSPSGEKIIPVCCFGGHSYNVGAATQGDSAGHKPNHPSENTHDADRARSPADGPTVNSSQSSMAAGTDLDVPSVLESPHQWLLTQPVFMGDEWNDFQNLAYPSALLLDLHHKRGSSGSNTAPEVLPNSLSPKTLSPYIAAPDESYQSNHYSPPRAYQQSLADFFPSSEHISYTQRAKIDIGRVRRAIQPFPRTRKRAAPGSVAGSERAMSVGSAASCSSYTTFGPRKGRRVAYKEDSETPPTMSPHIPIKGQASDGMSPETHEIVAGADTKKEPIKYQCAFCGQHFESLWRWQRHEQSTHAPSNCWVCGPSLFENLRKRVLPVGVFSKMHFEAECWQKPQDERTFFRLDHIVQHLGGTHKLDKAFWRKPLQFAYQSLGVPQSMFQCPVCDENLKDWSTRRGHLRDHFIKRERIKRLIPVLPFSSFVKLNEPG